MTRNDQIEALTKTLTLNYDMSEEFARGLSEFLYDEGCRIVPEGKWLVPEAEWIIESSTSIRCSNCCYNRVSIKMPLDHCPMCGARIIGHKESNSLDTLFDEVDMGTCSNKTYSDVGLVNIS